MHRNWGRRPRPQLRSAGEVVDMAVRQQDSIDLQPLPVQVLLNAIDLQAGIDYQHSLGVAPADDVAVLGEELVGKDRDLDRFAQFCRSHDDVIWLPAGEITTGSSSVIRTISSSLTPPQPGM